MFHQISGLSILVFRPVWVRFAFSTCIMLMSLKLVPYVILSMTLLNVTATLDIDNTRIGSKADVSTGYLFGGDDWISERRHGTEFCLLNRYHSHLSLIILGMLFCSRLTHSSRVVPDKIDSSNPTTTFSVSNLHIIAGANVVKVLPTPISSATSASGNLESHTHLLTMNRMAQTLCTRHCIPGRPGIQYLWPGTRSSVDW
jgi:hypothetical protein